MTNVERLKKFITDNNLDFPAGGRNINIVILIGYALYIDADIRDCKEAISDEDKVVEVFQEIERLYYYGEHNNYGKWWEIESNRNQYKL